MRSARRRDIAEVVRNPVPASVIAFMLSCLVLVAGCVRASEPVTPRPTPAPAGAETLAVASDPSIPRAAFLRQATIGAVQLSPDGNFVSFLRRDAQRLDLWLLEVASGKRTRVRADVDGVETAWSGDGRWLWLAEPDGLAVFDPGSGIATRILRWDRSRRQRFWGVDARATGHALIAERIDVDGATQHRYLRIDVQGATRVLYESAWPLQKALLAPDGSLAYSAAYDGPDHDTVVRRHTTGGTHELARCVGIESCVPVGFGARSGELWMLAHRAEDQRSLQRWREGEGWRTVHRDPTGVADAEQLLWDVERERWSAVAYYGERRRWHGGDAQTGPQLAALQRLLPDSNLDISRSADGRLWLVVARQSNWQFGRYFLYRTGRAELQRLFQQDEGSALAPEQLATARAVSWRARDGMRLHGYVYLPRAVDPARAPLIAWLHGGPFARLYDDYNGGIQLLVNRGNAVFVPNFRASTGYGLRYARAARGDVGNGRLLEDVLDGMDAMLAQGIGARDLQAVMGHSFGGYASLLAVSHHPGRFRFAFAGAAPTDYGWIKQWQADNETGGRGDEGPPVGLSFVHHGLPFEQPAWRERMRRESPLAALAGLREPVYLWAGALDERVPIKSLVHYAAEAGRLRKPLALLIDPQAGHTPSAQPLSVEAWFYLMENAAHRQFGGGLTPASPALAAFLRKHLRIDSQGLVLDGNL